MDLYKIENLRTSAFIPLPLCSSWIWRRGIPRCDPIANLFLNLSSIWKDDDRRIPSLLKISFFSDIFNSFNSTINLDMKTLHPDLFLFRLSFSLLFGAKERIVSGVKSVSNRENAITKKNALEKVVVSFFMMNY